MAYNRDRNKIRVVRTFGTDSLLGFMDPHVHMNVRHHAQSRWIKALDSGNFQVSLSLTSGGAVMAKAYPHDLRMDAPTASGWGWPDGAENQPQGVGHSGVFPLGVPVLSGTGLVFMQGDGEPYTFVR